MASISRLLLTVTLALAAACGDSGSGQTVEPPPNTPRLMPTPVDGWSVFTPVAVGKHASLPVSILNGGSQDLVVSTVTIQGSLGPDATAAFTVASTDYSTTPLKYGQALAIPVTFTPTSPGVYRAHVVIVSNAANNPSYSFELVGPATPTTIPDAPVIAFFPDDGAVSSLGGAAIAPVRFFNLGKQLLKITAYEISGAQGAAFSFLGGTTKPSAECATAACGAAIPAACVPVAVDYGNWVGLGLSYASAGGASTATFGITSNASNCPAAVTLSGP